MGRVGAPCLSPVCAYSMDRFREQQLALTIASPRLDHARSPPNHGRYVRSNGSETEPPRETPRPAGVPALTTSPTQPMLQEPNLPSARGVVRLRTSLPAIVPLHRLSVYRLLSATACALVSCAPCSLILLPQNRDRSPNPRVSLTIAVQSARGPSPNRGTSPSMRSRSPASNNRDRMPSVTYGESVKSPGRRGT